MNINNVGMLDLPRLFLAIQGGSLPTGINAGRSLREAINDIKVEDDGMDGNSFTSKTNAQSI